ncbi:MAG: hypothetical protein J6D21_02450 [Clostridia bacterium]|nr:hypothetical protein [Clostridia bacterium]
MLFHKDSTDENVKKYKEAFEKYIGQLDDQTEIYKVFTEITLLRLKLDKHDSFFKNIKDSAERSTVNTAKDLIVMQFNDIMITCKSYRQSDYELIDSTLKKILPSDSQNSNWVLIVFAWIKTGLDNATGRKK